MLYISTPKSTVQRRESNTQFPFHISSTERKFSVSFMYTNNTNTQAQRETLTLLCLAGKTGRQGPAYTSRDPPHAMGILMATREKGQTPRLRRHHQRRPLAFIRLIKSKLSSVKVPPLCVQVQECSVRERRVRYRVDMVVPSSTKALSNKTKRKKRPTNRTSTHHSLSWPARLSCARRRRAS